MLKRKYRKNNKQLRLKNKQYLNKSNYTNYNSAKITYSESEIRLFKHVHYVVLVKNKDNSFSIRVMPDKFTLKQLRKEANVIKTTKARNYKQIGQRKRGLVQLIHILKKRPQQRLKSI